MFKHLKFSLGVMTGAWLSAMLFCLALWSSDQLINLGPWWLFSLIVVSMTIVMSGLSSLLLSLALHRYVAPRRRFLAGVVAGVIAIPLCLLAGLMSEAPFSGNFLTHVCLITAMICLVTSMFGVRQLSRFSLLSKSTQRQLG